MLRRFGKSGFNNTLVFFLKSRGSLIRKRPAVSGGSMRLACIRIFQQPSTAAKCPTSESASEFISYPNEESSTATFVEGATRVAIVNAYERSSRARDACIKHFGLDCAVCGFNFEEQFGKIGEGFIHVHHLRDLAKVGGKYKVDPVNDLRPVCPNRHAMLHVETPAMSISKLKTLRSRSSKA